MERTIKAGARQYEAFAGEVVYMGDYEAPEFDKELEVGYEAYNFKGFDMLPIKSFVVQTGKALVENPSLNNDGAGNVTLDNNVRHYGHYCGALAMPTIIMYNSDTRCYYGLELLNHDTRGNDYSVTRYDAKGRYTSRRFISILNDNTVDEKYTTCNKKLYDFVFKMIAECKSNGHELKVRPYLCIGSRGYCVA